MNELQLKQNIQELLAEPNELGVAIYAVLKSDESAMPRKLDISADSLPGLRELFLRSLRESILDNDDLSIRELSSADERTDTIYRYDLELPNELSGMDAVIADDGAPLFDYSESSLTQIKALIVEIGNNEHQLVLYKTMAPVNIFGRSSFFMRKHNQRFERIDDEFFRVSSGFQLMKIHGDLFVLDIRMLERSFGFHEVIKKEAEAGISAIETLGILENIETLRELADDVRTARKLTRISKASPVIALGIPNGEIIQFCKSYPSLKGRLRFTETEDQIRLDTKVSKDLFIHLFMDDYLTSELTKIHYTSESKDEAQEVVE